MVFVIGSNFHGPVVRMGKNHYRSDTEAGAHDIISKVKVGGTPGHYILEIKGINIFKGNPTFTTLPTAQEMKNSLRVMPYNKMKPMKPVIKRAY
jgi:hypothetical protein